MPDEEVVINNSNKGVLRLNFLQYIKENIIAYHGSDKDFKEFENMKSKSFVGLSEIEVERNAFFFTTKKEYAKEYGENVIKVSLNLGKSLNELNEKQLAKILLPLIDKNEKGWWWSDGYSSDKVANLHVDDDPLEKTHWVQLFHDKYKNFYWTIFDEPKVVSNIKYNNINSAKVIEDDGEVTIAIFDKKDITII